ncbi:hypothetical protein HPP92_026916 [Vanilla planifolia]|uniref:Uncharacterized protein n=1 Tax=Vanilla planifolia TaxID=51239 RepID=A0A835PED3_VANPL|nr:hypothetical protein HPP92_026916 [Vanilla planifolia]
MKPSGQRHLTRHGIEDCRSSKIVQGGEEVVAHQLILGFDHDPSGCEKVSKGEAICVDHPSGVEEFRAGAALIGPFKPIYISRSPRRARIVPKVTLGDVRSAYDIGGQ